MRMVRNFTVKISVFVSLRNALQTPKEAKTIEAPIEEDPEQKKKNLEETLAQPVRLLAGLFSGVLAHG